MQNPSLPPISSPELDAIALDFSTCNSPSPFNWNDLDFDILPLLPADHSPQQQQPDFTQQQSDKVRKRDPRLTCSNFLAGRVPCACPELDGLIADKEEEEVGPGKKRARAGRVEVSGLLVCQVPGCEADISELKGYHRRHRVCLGCANAGSVVVDGEGRRYCQQCGKFHVLSDFDEGKRSCRRRLERHNNRRRRKSTDSKGLVDIDSQQVVLPEDGVFGDKIREDAIGLSSQIAEAERLLDTDEHISIPCPAPDSKNNQNDSGLSGGAYGDTKRDDKKDQSPSYYDNKSAFSSVCPTARISFKLYDWNPAEFPRLLRHQIFQWLASMPVELEGYIRPGCTILTLFIAMPSLMWDKLFEDPLAYLHDLIVGPGSILSGKGSFHVYLNNMVFRVTEDKTSEVKTLVGKQAPKIHHVHPTCFEAGKPMEFVVWGSDLLQPKLRFLVSFAGEYLIDVSGSSVFNMTDDNIASGSDYELLRISVPRTERNLFGPAFVEVENESGLSNFIPVLIGPTEICSEMNILQQKLNASHSKRPQIAVTGASSGVSLSSQKYISEFILDVAWMLKEPVLENKQIPISSEVQRFNYLFNFLIENESLALLERVAYYGRIVMNNRLTIGVADPDIKLYQSNVDRVNSILKQKFQNKIDSALHVKNLVFPVVPVVKPDMAAEKRKFVASDASASVDGSETVPLSNAEVIMNVKLVHEPRKASSHLFTNRALTSRPLLFVISAAAVCFGICAVVFHPEKVGEIAVNIRMCLFNQS